MVSEAAIQTAEEAKQTGRDRKTVVETGVEVGWPMLDY